MKILVLGNGFDLAHGLSTTYYDFIYYNREVGQTVFEDIVKEMDHLNGKRLIDHFWNNSFNNSRWEGFEMELSKIVQRLDIIRSRLKKNGKATIKASDKVILDLFLDKARKSNYVTENELKECKENAIIELQGLIRRMEIYFARNVNMQKIKPIKDILDIHPDKIINFNYTNTYERVYGVNDQENICYIHGKAEAKHSVSKLKKEYKYDEEEFENKQVYKSYLQEKSCNMVLGIDEYLNEHDSQYDNEYIQFKKFYQRIVKRTGSIYKDWLIQNDNQRIELYFFGHSLAMSDKDILRELINVPNAKVYFYYRNDESLGKTVEALVRLIGEEELIERVHGSRATIVFVKQKGGKKEPISIVDQDTMFYDDSCITE